MCRTGVRDNHDVGPGKRGEVCDFIGMIGTHFEHGILVTPLEPGQHERQPDLIVQVTLGRERLARAGQAGSHEFLECRLAVAPGDADHRRRLLRAPCSSESAERVARVSYRDLGQCFIDNVGNHCAGRADLSRPTDKVTAIEIRPAKREEQLASLQRAGVCADACKPGVSSVQLTLHGNCGR